MPLKEDHSEWLDQTMSTLNDMKQSKPTPTSKSWNRRIVISHRRKLYDSTQDKYCPLSFKKEARRLRQLDAMIDMSTKKSFSPSRSTSNSNTRNRTRPNTANASSSSSSRSRTRSKLNSSTTNLSSIHNNSSTGSMRSSSMRSSMRSSTRPSTAGANSRSRSSATSGSRKRGRRVKKKPIPTGGITYQQSSGNSGAHDDLRVVYKIMDRENLLIKIKTNATQYLTNHRWEAVSISSSVSSLNSKSKLLDSSVGAGAGVGAGNETNVSKGAILIETIRQDLLEVRRISLIVVHYIWLWRQDQILTLHERQHPSEYPPKPFVYNGHDYILKMINDLNYLKDLQPITAWLGAPMIRNPFALLFDDPNCIDNLDMQFDGSLADLAGCAHILPPPSITLDLNTTDPMCVKWCSLLLLAQEAIYGKGPESSSLMTGHTMTTNNTRGGSRSGTFTMPGESLHVTRSLLSENGSIINRDSPLKGGKNVLQPLEESKTEHSYLIESKNGNENGENSEKGEEEKEFHLHQHQQQQQQRKKTPKKFIKGERIKVQSKVKSVISQNAILRSELLRLRSQLEIERETLYQLEKAEKK